MLSAHMRFTICEAGINQVHRNRGLVGDHCKKCLEGNCIYLNWNREVPKLAGQSALTCSLASSANEDQRGRKDGEQKNCAGGKGRDLTVSSLRLRNIWTGEKTSQSVEKVTERGDGVCAQIQTLSRLEGASLWKSTWAHFSDGVTKVHEG